MTTNYIAIYTPNDGTTAYRIVRLFGRGGVDVVLQTLEKHGILPREIIRAPDKATLEQITDGITGPYQVMYIQGK